MPKRMLLVSDMVLLVIAGTAHLVGRASSWFRKRRRTTSGLHDLSDVAYAGRIDVPPEFEPAESGYDSMTLSATVRAVARYLSPVLLALMLWGCGASESDTISTPDPTSGPTTSSPTTTAPTTTVVTTTAAATTTTEAQPTTVVFTGEACSVEGATSIEAGLITVAVDNRSPNPAEAIIGRIDDGLDRATIEADVAAGLYDEWGLTGWEKPPGVTASPVRMPPNTPLNQSFAAEPGIWVVICLDILDRGAFMAPEDLDVK